MTIVTLCGERDLQMVAHNNRHARGRPSFSARHRHARIFGRAHACDRHNNHARMLGPISQVAEREQCKVSPATVVTCACWAHSRPSSRSHAGPRPCRWSPATIVTFAFTETTIQMVGHDHRHAGLLSRGPSLLRGLCFKRRRSRPVGGCLVRLTKVGSQLVGCGVGTNGKFCSVAPQRETHDS